MERAIVIGASGGIGSAVAQALVGRGVDVTELSRSRHGLDVADEASVAAAFSRIRGPFDLVFVATGILHANGKAPEKTLKTLSAQSMAEQFAVNCIGPSLILKHSIPVLQRKRRSVFAALSARVGSIGDNALGGWYSYRASKAALNQMIHTGAIELRRSHPQGICVALHPGTVATPFTAEFQARYPAVDAHTAAMNMLSVIDGLTVSDSGGFCDWRGLPVPW